MKKQRLDDITETLGLEFNTNGRDNLWYGKIKGDPEISCPVKKATKNLFPYFKRGIFIKDHQTPQKIEKYLEPWKKASNPFAAELRWNNQPLFLIKKGNYLIGALIKPWERINPNIASIEIYKRRIRNVTPINNRTDIRYTSFIEKIKKSQCNYNIIKAKKKLSLWNKLESDMRWNIKQMVLVTGAVFLGIGVVIGTNSLYDYIANRTEKSSYIESGLFSPKEFAIVKEAVSSFKRMALAEEIQTRK